MTPSPTPAVSSAQPPRLLDQLRAVAQQHGLPAQRAERYAGWVRRYILFHNTRHPRELGAAEVGRFLDHLAHTETDPVSRTLDARDALRFLYEQFLGQPLGDLPVPPPPRLLDQLRHALRVRHYSPRTEECYVQWATRFILFHGKRHPRSTPTSPAKASPDSLVGRQV
jgi:Phage integrase, N-terminal SAM-like domain